VAAALQDRNHSGNTGEALVQLLIGQRKRGEEEEGVACTGRRPSVLRADSVVSCKYPW
jgi:hypothetical protein